MTTPTPKKPALRLSIAAASWDWPARRPSSGRAPGRRLDQRHSRLAPADDPDERLRDRRRDAARRADDLPDAQRPLLRPPSLEPDVPVAQGMGLDVDGEVERPLRLSAQDLRRMPRTEVTCVLQCAGNGRGLFEPPVPGVQWKYGAVGNARWTGVRVRDILERAGLKAGARHLHTFGTDKPPVKVPPFHRSIEIEKVLADAIVADEMNGEPLPAPHGGPARLVVPGWAGEHWMKWLDRLSAQPEAQKGFYMETAYRYPKEPGAPGVVIPAAEMRSVTELFVKSCITEAPARARAGVSAVSARVRVLRSARRREGRGDRRRRRDLAAGGARPAARPVGLAALVVSLGPLGAGSAHALGAGDGQPGRRPAEGRAVEPERIPPQRLALRGGRGDGVRRARAVIAAAPVSCSFSSAASGPRKPRRSARARRRRRRRGRARPTSIRSSRSSGRGSPRCRRAPARRPRTPPA